MKIAVFPGSFDPITVAHVNILERAAPLFDKIIIGIGTNSTKQGFLTSDQKKSIADSIFRDMDNIEVELYQGLTVDFCKAAGAKFIIRGVRSTIDFEYEKAIAQMNQNMMPELETILLFSRPDYAAISSTIVREILKNGGDVSLFVPPQVIEHL
ncbi:MAG: pantetheine-phosphate adenylyltransferase [Bacteroidota bacterium]